MLLWPLVSKGAATFSCSLISWFKTRQRIDKAVDGCSVAFQSYRKHMLPMGTACTGPDLSHSRSQWPSACLPSCQAALSQTHCKHIDIISSGNPQIEECKGKKWERERACNMDNHGSRDTLKLVSDKEKQKWWRTSDRLNKGELNAQVTGKPQSLRVKVREKEKRENEREKEQAWVKEFISCLFLLLFYFSSCSLVVT